MMKVLLYGVVVLVTLTLAVPAQEAVTSSFGLLPGLPRPGEAFPESHYVFQGPTAYDITVIYPERAADGRVIGVRKQVRIPLGNRVQPDVECEVTQRATSGNLTPDRPFSKMRFPYSTFSWNLRGI